MKISLIITLLSFAIHSQAVASNPKNMDLDQVIEEMEKTLNWLPKKEIYHSAITTQGSETAPAAPKETAPAVPKEPVTLVKGYQRYNIVFYDGVYYGVHMGDGSIDVRSIDTVAQMPWVKAASKEKVMALIRDLARSSGQLDDPILIQEGYRGHNIVLHNDLFIGVHQQEGPIDVRNIKSQSRFPWTTAPTVEEVRAEIDKLILEAEYNTPILVEANYKAFNIVKYKKYFYGVDLREGAIEVPDIKAKATFDWFKNENIDNVKKEIDTVFNKMPFKSKVRWQLSRFKRSVKQLVKSIVSD